MHHIDVRQSWPDGPYHWFCTCGADRGGFFSESRAQRAGRQHVAWYADPVEDEVELEVTITAPKRGRPATITPDKLIPPIRLAQPVNPHRRTTHDLEDTEEL